MGVDNPYPLIEVFLKISFLFCVFHNKVLISPGKTYFHLKKIGNNCVFRNRGVFIWG